MSLIILQFFANILKLIAKTLDKFQWYMLLLPCG